MTVDRKRKTLRLTVRAPEDRETIAQTLIGDAMARHICLRWTYNRVIMQVAPMLLYRRNDALYVDAVVLEKNAVRQIEPRLASFRLSGLSHLAALDERFETVAADVDDPRYAQGIILQA